MGIHPPTHPHAHRYAACISQRCADHGLVTHGPWARYVEKALRIPKHSLKWSNCLGIYVLLSHPGATPCGWHTDFSPDAPARDAYLHKVVNVFIPLQDMTERMGFTVVLDREKGRCQIPARQQGQWYALVSRLRRDVWVCVCMRYRMGWGRKG